MTTAVFASQVLFALFAQVPAVLTYDGVPNDVSRVTAYEWREGAPPEPLDVSSQRSGAAVSLRAARAGLVAVTFGRADGQYLIDGPFVWPASPVRRRIESQWRRTERGAFPADVAGTPAVDWIRADTLDETWPRCVRDASAWECWGVQASNRGIIVLAAAERIWSTIAAPTPIGPLRPSAWGRLLVLSDSSEAPAETRIVFGHPVAPPAERLAGIRLDTASVPGARAVPISANSVWITGENVPPKAWVEICTARGGPRYVSLQELADGAPAVPVRVSLPDRRMLTGRVTNARGGPAAGALVTVFRLIDPPPPPGSRLKPRRVFAAETVARDDGLFDVERLGEADYEILVWHSQFGRSSQTIAPAQTEVDIHLAASGVARGRVLAGGRPAAGIPIVSVPDPTTFNAADDLTDAKGGDSRTGADGRFTVMVAAAGGGELRIGGGEHGVKRVPLPRPPVATLDLGDITLAMAIELAIVLDRDPGCAVRAVGPVGRTGLQIVSGVRTPAGTYTMLLPEDGLWQFGLVCGGSEKRSLTPGTMRISATQNGKEVHFLVR